MIQTGEIFMMIIKDFTKPEIDHLWRNCNFVGDEMLLFEARSKGIPLEQIAEDLNMSVENAKRISRKVNSKISKVMERSAVC